MDILKKIIKSNSTLERLATYVIKLFQKNQFFPGSQVYWENRYQKGGTSGSGSYNRLAIFKAEVVNLFVREKKIKTIIEFGCGDGNQLALATYPKYIGVDVSPSIIQLCQEKFKEDPSKEFYLYNSIVGANNKSDFVSGLSLSLDVIYHLIEDHVFETYMKNLFFFAERYVIIYSSNYNSTQNYHEKDRKFEDWINNNAPQWKLQKKIENKYKFDSKDPKNTSKSDFYIYEKVN